MKALILAAGFGKRLMPYSTTVPKPLFKILGKPVLELQINNLVNAGCTHIYINVHHLHEQITEFVCSRFFKAEIETVHEPDILGTAGAIANLESHLNDQDFFVVNADVVCTIDLKELLHEHRQNLCTATLALHSCPEFNKIRMDEKGFIRSFSDDKSSLAFTGIQVLSPDIFEHLGAHNYRSSISLYTKLMDRDLVRGKVFKDHYWADIGTPERFSKCALDHLAARALDKPLYHKPQIIQLKGDGSDRIWYRVKIKNRSAIICDHGIRIKNTQAPDEFDSFLNLGCHLHDRRVSVPKIIGHDSFSGMIALEDLGDERLDLKLRSLKSFESIITLYKAVCDELLKFSRDGFYRYNPCWAYQSRYYDVPLIMEKECRYFMDAFVKGLLNLDVSFSEYEAEFNYIAGRALDFPMTGLMHRDCQSRNIMIKDDRVYFIDFQAARIGPIQYDLASLLIDPYVELSGDIRAHLLSYAVERYMPDSPDSWHKEFENCFYHCCITRNFQILGAFSHLGTVKNKPFFLQYIPKAARTLKTSLSNADTSRIPKLIQLSTMIEKRLETWTQFL